MRLRRSTRSLAAIGLTLALLPFLPGVSANPGVRAIEVLSGRADLVSGGDALLALTGFTITRGLHVNVAGRDETSAFRVVANGKLEGLVTGLRLGTTVVTVRTGTGPEAQIVLTNHPIGGPIFAGPEIQPWACQPGAVDRQCDAAVAYTYFYLPAGAGGVTVEATGVATVSTFQPYDMQNPPPAASIASTTSDTGVTVPFIVRKETGYLDRDQYAIAALWQPGRPWSALQPQPQFNHTLVLTHGASCDETFGTGTAPEVMNPTFLGHGFVVASHALDNAGHNCNIATQAESLIMTKERVVKRYGELRWTIGSGCSGGSLVQQQVANAYPGVYQAITPQCASPTRGPRTWSTPTTTRC